MNETWINGIILDVLGAMTHDTEKSYTPDTPLGVGGAGLDSIGILELVLEIERLSGIRVRSESLAATDLETPQSLADYIIRTQH